MTLDLALLAFTFGSLLWGLLGFVIFLVALILTIVILLQESKEGGLAGGLGGGLGGESFLGAKGQKDIARFTAILAVVFGVLVIGWGSVDTYTGDASQFDDPASEESLEEVIQSAGEDQNAAPAAPGGGPGSGGVPAPETGTGEPRSAEEPPPSPRDAGSPGGDASRPPAGS